MNPPLPRDPKQRRFWHAAHGSAAALAIAQAARTHGGIVVAVTRDTQSAHALESDLRVFAGSAEADGQLDVLHLPDWETLPYDLFPPHPEIVSQRIAALYRLPTTLRGVLVVPVATLMQRLAPRSFIGGSSLILELHQTLDLGQEQRRLEAAGYRHVPQVQEPGDFAVRGALLDVFPMGSAEPYRIELFDREIDSIRTFDPETQRSAHKVEKVNLLPAREFPLTESAVKAFRNTLRERFPIDPRRCPLYQDLKEGTTPAGIEYYLPMFFERTETLFDYLDERTLFVLAENTLGAAESFWQQAQTRYDSRAHDIERPILPVAELYLPPDRLREQLNLKLRVEIVAPDSNEHAVDLRTQPAPLLPVNRRGEAPAYELKKFLDTYPGRVLIAADSAGRREALIDQLAQANLKPQVVASWREFLKSSLPNTIRRGGEKPSPPSSLGGENREGSALHHPGNPIAPSVSPHPSPLPINDADGGEGARRPLAYASPSRRSMTASHDRTAITVLTERQLFGERAKQSRRHKIAVRDPEAVLRDLSGACDRAPIVHADHGVGRYQGLIKLDVGRLQSGGAHGEFLCIDYAKGDKLYVPVAQLQLVSRYSGTAPELAPLHSLGGDAWEPAKRKAAQKVRDVAAELLALYAQREARPGHAFACDQSSANSSPRRFRSRNAGPDPGDRSGHCRPCLGQGDGPRRLRRRRLRQDRGRLRAAFVAAIAGKQVAVLVPTTLLRSSTTRISPTASPTGRCASR